MKLTELRALIEGHAPGSLIPRDWLLRQLDDVGSAGGEGVAEPLADLTVEEAGRVLDRSPSTVRDYARRELLPGAYRQRGREWRIPRSAIRAFQRAEAAENCPQEPSAPRGDDDLSSWREEARRAS